MRENERLAADIAITRAQTLSLLSLQANIKSHQSSTSIFSSNNLTPEQHMYLVGLYGSHLAIRLANAHLSAGRHFAIAGKTGFDIGGVVLNELDYEDAKWQYSLAVKHFRKGGLNQYSIKILLEAVSILWSSGDEIYMLEAISLLEEGQKVVQNILSNK